MIHSVIVPASINLSSKATESLVAMPMDLSSGATLKVTGTKFATNECSLGFFTRVVICLSLGQVFLLINLLSFRPPSRTLGQRYGYSSGY